MDIDLSFLDNFKKTKVDCDYDFEKYNQMKKVPDSEYDYENDVWIIKTKYVKQLIKDLDAANKDVINQLNETGVKFQGYKIEDKKEVIKTVKLSVLKENAKSLNINFDYDENVIEYVKMMDNRQFNGKSKTWRIGKNEVDWLCAKLDSLKYVDTTELYQYLHNSKVEISLDNYPKMTITPKNYQINVANKLLTYKKFINGLQAGLGKTLITCLATEHLQKKTLVICLSSNKHDWRKEIHKVNPDADVNVLGSTDKWKSSQYVVMNYDILGKFRNEINTEGFEVLVIDEAHKIRGVNGRGEPTSQRAKYTLNIAKKCEYVFPITATPFINYTKDIFNILQAVDHPSANDWYMFSNTYCGAENNGFGTTYNGSSKREQLNEKIYPLYMERMLTEDVIELPERMRSFIPVEINKKRYEQKVEEYFNNRKTLETNGQHLTELTIMRKELAIEKAKHAVDIAKNIIEQNKSVTIYTNYTDVAEYLESKFKDDCVKITGDVSEKDREKAKELFQSGKKKVFIGNMDAAGEAITLTKAHEMIVTDLHWSPIIMTDQVEKRIHRISQEEIVNIRYLYCEDAKLDNLMIGMLNKKLSDASTIVDGKSQEFFVEELINNL